MPASESLRAFTHDDEQARRLLKLAVCFSNAKSPLSTTDILRDFYDGVDDRSSRRKFERDREKLVECGFAIRQTPGSGKEKSWEADPASFANSEALTPQDARLLDVLCAPLVNDPAFAPRNELRLALAKIDHAFGSLSAVRVSQSRQEQSALQTMLSCQGTRFADITYVKADGKKNLRHVAPLGHFGLRDQVYFVCANEVSEQAGATGIRTLRLDRIVKARANTEAFAMPEDFCIDDYVMLPFQLGPKVAEIVLSPTTDVDADLLRALDRDASVDGVGQRTTWAADLDAAARWAIAAGLRPEAPKALVDAWSAVLRDATQAQASSQPQELDEIAETRRAGNRGRKGGIQEFRELLALAGSLESEGATITPSVVSARLGVSPQRADALIELLLTSSSGSDCENHQLPLAQSEGDAYYLANAQGTVGRPVRLTQSELHAVSDALDELGVTRDHELRLRLNEAFATPGLDLRELERRVRQIDFEQSDDLEACSNAILEGKTLTFRYRKPGEAQGSSRTIIPQALRHERGHWLVDAYDLDRRGQRTFRFDRMEDLRVRSEQGTPVEETPKHEEHMVGLAFHDRSMLDLFEWPRLEILGTHKNVLYAQLPSYEGPWLTRHLAACAGLVTTSDDALATRVRELAKDLLG